MFLIWRINFKWLCRHHHRILIVNVNEMNGFDIAISLSLAVRLLDSDCRRWQTAARLFISLSYMQLNAETTAR